MVPLRWQQPAARAIDVRVAYSSTVSDATGAARRLHLTGLFSTRQASLQSTMLQSGELMA